MSSSQKDFPKDRPAPSRVRHDSLSGSGVRVSLRTDPPGLIELPGLAATFVSIHIGSPVQVSCCRSGIRHRGVAVHGDIDIIPAYTPSSWELRKADAAVLLGISAELMNAVARELNFDPKRVEIRNRFQVRDPQIEHIGWALKAEMDSGFPSGRLFADSLAASVAGRLVQCHSSVTLQPARPISRIPNRRLKQVLSYIEENISENISLVDVAAIAGQSVSHFQRLFRESVGLPVHQYVIHRRVERAKSLLASGSLPISQIAIETGFTHQSHLAYHVRRILGVSPRTLRNLLH